ncbi:Ionotropic receptor 25a-like 1 [Homarus americanus]|uniref:Ionotropic receptor 25a-like 1 n=1 Tax=Homarus americanus TaxID=6706 RepID=A0A8J5MT49_HOMAM|nr:Ionotropic receptor 25a-like 1 [Homarus americanus]
MWQSMQGGWTTHHLQAVLESEKSTSSSEGFAYLRDATQIRYAILTSCDMMSVGDEFSRKPFAIAVTKGSPLKDQLSGAHVHSTACLVSVSLPEGAEHGVRATEVLTYALNMFPDTVTTFFSLTSPSPSHLPLSGDATDIRYQVLTNCDLQIVGEEFSRKPYAIAVQQGSPLKDQFNDALVPGGVFIVIFVGIGLACVTLAFEYWWYKHRKGPRVTDSAKVLAVREYPTNDVDKTNFNPEKSDFNTQYNTGEGFDIAPVANPW